MRVAAFTLLQDEVRPAVLGKGRLAVARVERNDVEGLLVVPTPRESAGASQAVNRWREKMEKKYHTKQDWTPRVEEPPPQPQELDIPLPPVIEIPVARSAGPAVRP